jgi:hypothetical protein
VFWLPGPIYGLTPSRLVFKTAGVAMVTRSDINKVAAAYCLTGVVGGLGLALVLGLGKWAGR